MSHPDDKLDVFQIQAELAKIMAESYGGELPPLPDDIPILELGVGSLMLVEGMRRVYERFGVLVSIRKIIEGQITLGGLALYIEEILDTQQVKTRSQAAFTEWKMEREIPMAPSQQHIGFLSRYSNEAGAAFNESLLLRLNGTLHGPAFQAAFEQVINRYEALRTALNPETNGLEIGTGTVRELIASSVTEENLQQRLTEIVSRPFEPGRPLFRAELLRLSENDHVLALVGHALVIEHQALVIVAHDLAELYGLFAQDKDAPPAPPILQWADYLAMGETPKARKLRDRAEQYWQAVFASGAPRLELPTDFPRPPIKKYNGARASVPLGPALDKRLDEWAAKTGKSREAALLAAFTVFLHRLAATDELAVGIESQPLYLETGMQAVAHTRNMLPVRSAYDPAKSFETIIAALADAFSQADSHRNLSLAELIRLLHVPRDQSRSALFTAGFRSQTQDSAPVFEGLQSTYLLAATSWARYDIELIVVSSQVGSTLLCDYSNELFEAGTISRWLDGMLTLLSAALEDTDQPCGTLPMLRPDEREQILVEWNHTEKSFPRERTVFDLIMDQAQHKPERPAIRFEETTLSYGQMLKRVNSIAIALQARGVKHHDRVGILLHRSLDLIPTLLAAWGLGALYVPMDAGFPESRLAYMLADAGVQTVVTSHDLIGRLDEERRSSALCLEDIKDDATIGQVSPATGADSAYIIYTSGSTGKPKGVEVRHSALVNALLASKDNIEFGPQHLMLALTTISFDISTVEMFVPLMAGGCVEVGGDGLVADGLQLAEKLAARNITHVQATPSIWKSILTAGWQGNLNLCILTAGEALSRELAEQLLEKAGTVWNLYGPTETTVYSSSYRVETAPEKPIRIGRPFPNTKMYILDKQLQPVPLGAVGELYIGGDGLAVGYWQKPELTGERFIANPFCQGERIYSTGDLARYEPGGEIICLGRVDDQVKIHGVRIELGEIESALRSLTAVRDAVVTSWMDAHGDKQLVAHVIPNAAGAITAPELRTQLRERLPEVMIPPYILFAENFPLTANGKVRRASLPAPDTVYLKADEKMVQKPETATEKAIAKAWASLLGIDVNLIGRDSDFMDLGGHSLLMTLLMVEVRRLFQVSFSLREFFAASSLSKFSALVDERIQQAKSANTKTTSSSNRSSEWARQRMAFLQREAQLPHYIAPVRGAVYQPVDEIRTVFLTGGTGFLGAYTIAEILKTTRAEIYCLVRPKRGEDGKKRIEQQMRYYEVWVGDEAWQSAWENRLHVVEGDVTLPRLGMKDAVYETLAQKVDAIFHGAAHVNFIYPYEALRATNVLGVHEIIQFAFHLRIKPVHHLSTAAIWPMGAKYTYYERDSIDHIGVLNLGYDEAKWVGERCLLHAADRGLPVARYRPGEVGGDSVTGHCVTDHFIIACFKGFLQFGAFPELDVEVDVAPVDYVAKAMVHLAFRRDPLGRAFHLTNPSRVKMKDGYNFLRSLGYQLKELPFMELRDALVNNSDFANNALFAYQAALEEMNNVSMELPTYDTRETKRELEGSGIVCAPADEKLFGTYFRYLQNVGFIPQPESLTASI